MAFRSRAIKRESLVAVKMRWAQADPASGSGSLQDATPRHTI
jgi:hypothetical protein